MPGFGLVEALLDAEEARKPKPHPAGLDQKVAYRMLTQLGLEPDVPGGAVEVRQQDTPELFATLVRPQRSSRAAIGNTEYMS